MLYNVNLSSNNAELNTAEIGVDNDKLILDGNNGGKSLIQTTNELCIDMNAPAPNTELIL